MRNSILDLGGRGRFPDESLMETGTFPQIVSVLTNQHFPMKNSVKNSQPALILPRLTQG